MSNRPKIKKKTKAEDVCLCCVLRARGREIMKLWEHNEELRETISATSEEGEKLALHMSMNLYNAAHSLFMASDNLAMMPNDMKQEIPNYAH